MDDQDLARTKRVQIRMGGDIEARMLRVSNSLGLTIGTTASTCAAIGLRMMEQVLYAAEAVAPVMGQVEQMQGAALAADVEAIRQSE